MEWTINERCEERHLAEISLVLEIKLQFGVSGPLSERALDIK